MALTKAQLTWGTQKPIWIFPECERRTYNHEFFVSGFHVVLPTLTQELRIPEAAQTWPSSVFSLVVGAMLLPMGRLADIYGGRLVFVGGLLWFSLWALITGFSKNYTMLIICRAMQGLGPAAYLPGGVMLMGKLYPPGQRKNLIFALYGAFGPLGFFSGILAGGLTVEYLSWPWYFWVGAVMLGIISGVSIFAVPFDYRDRCRGDTMDWLGTATIVPGLVMVSYALTDSPHAGDGWFTAYIVIIGMLFLMSAWYVETRRAVSPLLPSTLFAPKYIKPLLLANFMSFGSFGLFLFYSSLYIELVLHKSPLTTAMWYIPMIVGGLAIGVVGGFTLHFLPGRVLLVISSLANTVCMLLFALMPEGANYWAWVFPAMVCATVGVDVTFTDKVHTKLPISSPAHSTHMRVTTGSKSRVYATSSRRYPTRPGCLSLPSLHTSAQQMSKPVDVQRNNGLETSAKYVFSRLVACYSGIRQAASFLGGMALAILLFGDVRGDLRDGPLDDNANQAAASLFSVVAVSVSTITVTIMLSFMFEQVRLPSKCDLIVAWIPPVLLDISIVKFLVGLGLWFSDAFAQPSSGATYTEPLFLVAATVLLAVWVWASFTADKSLPDLED
ncbi:hypothetical protein MRS44_003922 [Fusarium solani]|uniref:uncharacterized protein n=1 Tax=Fusarium solani TaxID=169388 RepID=UPI0032C40474|nr:hypothetical protein MRS44_003922 [Fusarium solani]